MIASIALVDDGTSRTRRASRGQLEVPPDVARFCAHMCPNAPAACEFSRANIMSEAVAGVASNAAVVRSKVDRSASKR